MNDAQDRDEVMQRRLDWALREVAGGEQAPDVTAAVLARAARGDVVDDGAVAPARARPWLAAALLMLGIGVVVAVFVAERQRSPAAPDPEVLVAPQGGEECIEVTQFEAIASLPRDARAVELRNLDDAAVKALVRRCPKLEHLRVFASTAYSRAGDPARAVSITDAALTDIGLLTDLRNLQLIGTNEVRGDGLRQLERLPMLMDLELSYFDLDDDALQVMPRLPSLQRLSLHANIGFGDRGLAAIANCPGLRQLVLTSCSQLHAGSLRQLGRLVHLRQLNLNGIGNSWRGLGQPDARLYEPIERAKAEAERTGAGMRVAGLSDWPELTYLDLGGNHLLEPEVGQRLREGCPNLRMLELPDCPLIDDTTVAEVLGLRHLRRLDLSKCAKISEFSLPLLIAATQLQEIHLDDTPWLNLRQAEQLFASGKRVLATKTGDAAFNAGMAVLASRYEAALSQPRYERVASLAEIEALPADVTHVEVRDLGDAAAVALAKRPGLVGVRFCGDPGRLRLGDEAFAAFARMRSLAELDLRNVDGVHDSGLRQLQGLPQLHVLRLRGLNDADDSLTMLAALASLPKFAALEELDLMGTTTFVEQGLDAIVACKQLTRLSLRGCEQLRPQWIARLGALTGLESLDLIGVRGVDDDALDGLRPLTRLRTLLLANGSFTAAGLRAVDGMRALQSLALSDSRQLGTSALLHLPVTLTDLHLGGCSGMDASAGVLLRDRFPGLLRLDVAGDDWVDDAALGAILQLPRLESLVIRSCKNTTAKSFAAIVAARSLRRLDARLCGWLTEALAKQLEEKRPELQVTSKTW